MITHVAEASELSGRVVLWLDPESRCTPTVLEAPLRLARAYDAEIETIVVDQRADESGEVPFRRIGHVSLPDVPPVAYRFQLLAQRCRRTVEDAGRTHKVKVRHALAQGDAVDRISEMCLMRGPWNIVALTGTPAVGGQSVINSLLANVSGATGFLLCGDALKNRKTGVVVIVEDGERLPSMLRAAERLSLPGAAIHLVIGAETAAEHADLEHQARLLTADALPVVFAPIGPTFGVPGAMTEIVARMKPSFVVARFGGTAVADGRELSRASAAIQAPILLVR
ncbi:MAG: hypothetical protein WC026_12090 [Hyphomicrobium sp.]|uniref:hypothetical protein n=1 Tax=Hyphomicrobium sp. TaxID=82 RepID=UPI0035683AFC